jgi:tRNA 2-thiouridine synthesizing protein A
VLADDPGSVKDFEAFSRQTGNELLESRELGDHYLFLLRKHAE